MTDHSFLIPVMGTGFTIDTPLRVARYGISSVLSLVDDILIEQMRKYWAQLEGEPYEEIGPRSDDVRARRIRAYLDLIDRTVGRQVEALRASRFEPGSEITRYHELLPDGPKRCRYLEMLDLPAGPGRDAIEDELRSGVAPGGIDVNIMTKLDRSVGPDGKPFPPDSSDAVAAARGYADSTLRGSTLVLSAGMNPRLFSYIAGHPAFRPDAEGHCDKTLTLKVSDYRSALIQGKFLAKKGVWVSEYRVESGLNCGGHAFPTKGLLLGPILDEFQQQRASLLEQVRAAFSDDARPEALDRLDASITVQGGIGTAAEHELMREHYGVDRVGWGTPFLLVPEVTNVDDGHLKRLSAATADDVWLSDASPLKVPFWNLRESASEQARRARIADGRPGSACPNGYAVTSKEFTEAPQCIAARAYQKLKLEEVDDADGAALRQLTLAPSCICHDLAGGATLKHGIDADATPAICPGPAVQDFSKVASLDEMASHIYGRSSLLANSERPHVFIRELSLYLDYLRRERERVSQGLSTSKEKYFDEFRANLAAGVEYYRGLCDVLPEESRASFRSDLEKLAAEIATAG
ncbi:MAG: hypothetical protein JRG82_06485 [Deltaproteobacteria bacterium]|nr:hypothetical protein [Deltaproteobacteria bacterium]